MRPEILRYAELLLEWNRTISLTGAQTLEQIEGLIADADALIAASWNGIATVIDIGSGGGLPAVPLAVTMPQVRFTLLEANARCGAPSGQTLAAPPDAIGLLLGSAGRSGCAVL
ncbi:MAG TPA: RsmG family class I SAM-dependent methyltransferase, partial [Candidatus Dormibacteraeota bacterium]